MHYSKEDILAMVEENGVKFIRLQFTDILGTLKNVAITDRQLEKALNNQCMFDGSSINGFVRVEESDMYLRPDLDTFVIFPWRPQQGKVARLICDVYMPDGTPFEGDPRYILKKAINKAEAMGYTMNVGPECEFFLFEVDNDEQLCDCYQKMVNNAELYQQFVELSVKRSQLFTAREAAKKYKMMFEEIGEV